MFSFFSQRPLRGPVFLDAPSKGSSSPRASYFGPQTKTLERQGEECFGKRTVRVKIITGSLVILENLLSQNYRYRYRLESRMKSFNYHYRYRRGVRSHPFISFDSQLPS